MFKQSDINLLRKLLNPYPITAYTFSTDNAPALCLFGDLSEDYVLKIKNLLIEFNRKILLFNWGGDKQNFLDENISKFQLLQPKPILLTIEQKTIDAIFDKFKSLGYRIIKTPNGIGVKSNIHSENFNFICKINLTNHHSIAELGEICHQFRSTPFDFWLTPSCQPFDLNDILRKNGAVTKAYQYIMKKDLNDFSYLPSKGLELKEIENIDIAEDFLNIFASNYPCGEQFYASLKDDFHKHKFDKKFVAYNSDNIPVAIAALTIRDTFAGISNLVTLSEYRNQGIGRNIINFLLHFSAKRKCKTAHLIASSINSRRLYERLGFSTIGLCEDLSGGNFKP